MSFFNCNPQPPTLFPRINSDTPLTTDKINHMKNCICEYPWFKPVLVVLIIIVLLTSCFCVKCFCRSPENGGGLARWRSCCKGKRKGPKPPPRVRPTDIEEGGREYGGGVQSQQEPRVAMPQQAVREPGAVRSGGGGRPARQLSIGNRTRWPSRERVSEGVRAPPRSHGPGR